MPQGLQPVLLWLGMHACGMHADTPLCACMLQIAAVAVAALPPAPAPAPPELPELLPLSRWSELAAAADNALHTGGQEEHAVGAGCEHVSTSAMAGMAGDIGDLTAAARLQGPTSPAPAHARAPPSAAAAGLQLQKGNSMGQGPEVGLVQVGVPGMCAGAPHCHWLMHSTWAKCDSQPCSPPWNVPLPGGMASTCRLGLRGCACDLTRLCAADCCYRRAVARACTTIAIGAGCAAADL